MHAFVRNPIHIVFAPIATKLASSKYVRQASATGISHHASILLFICSLTKGNLGVL